MVQQELTIANEVTLIYHKIFGLDVVSENFAIDGFCDAQIDAADELLKSVKQSPKAAIEEFFESKLENLKVLWNKIGFK